MTVWHGDADRTVAHSNAGTILGQWQGVHGIGSVPDRSETVDGHRHRVWFDRQGKVAIDEYAIAGHGHGTPLKTAGPDSCGNAGAHMLEAGISSTWRQAEAWGLIDREAMAAASVPMAVPSASTHVPQGVGATIERALRSAGLM